MTAERPVESEDRQNGILRLEKTTQDELGYCENVGELLGDYITEGKADFSDYEGVEIPTIIEWFDEGMIYELGDWITKGIDKHYTKGKGSLGFRLDLYLLGQSMSEGIKNALEHGNKEDPEKRVLIRWNLRNTSINISIIDEGTEIIDLTPKSHITGDLLEEVFSGGGNGVKIIRDNTGELGGIATWNPINDKQGQKIGTELEIKIPISQSM